MSSVDGTFDFIQPQLVAQGPKGTREDEESATITSLISTLDMMKHPEGGYFVETDRDALMIPSPFSAPTTPSSSDTPAPRPGFDPSKRNASTTIFYLLTPNSPKGNFHRNKARTVHTLHKGRGRYVVLHPPKDGGDGRHEIESFVVGHDIAKGEKLQWIVEGNRYKASFLLPDEVGNETSEEGLLISETVVPGFEFCDHDFLKIDDLANYAGSEGAVEMQWLVRQD